MCRFWWRERQEHGRTGGGRSCIHVVGLVLCLGILVVNVFEKFREGGVGHPRGHRRGGGACFVWIAAPLPQGAARTSAGWTTSSPRCRKSAAPARPLDPKKPTAVLLVGGYAGLGRALAAHHPAALPQLLPELRLPLGGGHRLGHLQGHRRGGGGEGAHPEGARRVRDPRARPRARGRRRGWRSGPRRWRRRRSSAARWRRSSRGRCSSPASWSSSRSAGTSGCSTTRPPTSSSAGSSSPG